MAPYLRPVLEGFLRRAKSADFGPGELIGRFLNRCRAALRGGVRILSEGQILELHDLNDYASRFHHENIADCETALSLIDVRALKRYAERTLHFASPAEPPAA